MLNLKIIMHLNELEVQSEQINTKEVIGMKFDLFSLLFILVYD